MFKMPKALSTVLQISLLKVALLAVLATGFGSLWTDDGYAQRGRSLPLVRDAEIEGLLQDYARPIFKAAGLGRGAVDIYLINKPEFNAFVTGSRMFFNTGALQQSKTPNEIIGVIAHETGHIVGGHLARLRDSLERAQAMAVIGALLGAGAIAAGGEGGNAAGQAILHGSQQAARRSLLSYQRNEEIAADRTAVTLMNKTGQSPQGIIDTFKTISKNRLFSSSRVDPYAQSHPLPRDRIALLDELVQKSKYRNKKDPASLQLRHDMMRAKIAAYSGGAGAVRSVFSRSINSAPARYGNAIATYLAGSPARAIPQIDKLIKEQPKNPYLYEIKGEMLLRSGRAKQAIAPLKKAVSLDRYKSSLMRIDLGHAYLESGDPKLINTAIKELLAAVGRDRDVPRAYGLLARAYGVKKDRVRSLAFSAEEQFYQGKVKNARQLALRAQPKLKRGSPQWLRLKDIIDYKPVK